MSIKKIIISTHSNEERNYHHGQKNCPVKLDERTIVYHSTVNWNWRNEMRRILPKALFILLMIPALASCMGSRGSSWSEDGLDVATAITAQYRKISPQLAKEMMDSTDPVLVVDVRTPSEFAGGHIEGAISLPNETITTARQPEALPDKDAVILVYCRSGNRSAQAARKLVSLGYVNVYDFGGILDWPYEIVR